MTKEDIDLILQLVNELRSELTDKNVRLAPVEEELNALKEKVRNRQNRRRAGSRSGIALRS